MKLILVPTLSLAVLGLAAFTLAAKSPATTAPAFAAPKAATAALTYTVDPVHSTVIFSTMHLGTSRSYGRFNDIAGTITVDTEKPEACKVSIQIKTDSIDTANKQRDDHLRGPDFFEVKEYPLAKFESSSVKKSGEKTWSVTGDLSLHGVKKEVTLALEATGTGKGFDGESVIGFHGTFSILRSEYGIEYGPKVLGDKVDLIVSIEAASK